MNGFDGSLKPSKSACLHHPLERVKLVDVAGGIPRIE